MLRIFSTKRFLWLVTPLVLIVAPGCTNSGGGGRAVTDSANICPAFTAEEVGSLLKVSGVNKSEANSTLFPLNNCIWSQNGMTSMTNGTTSKTWFAIHVANNDPDLSCPPVLPRISSLGDEACGGGENSQFVLHVRRGTWWHSAVVTIGSEDSQVAGDEWNKRLLMVMTTFLERFQPA